MAVLIALPMASADWLMTGGDAQATGRVDGHAPTWGDVALTVALPLTAFRSSEPLMVEGSMYIADGRITGLGQVTYSLIRVDLATGSVETVAEMPGADNDVTSLAPQLASDGHRLFVLANNLLYTVDPLTREVSVPLSIAPVSQAYVADIRYCCIGPDRQRVVVYEAGRLYVASGPPLLGTQNLAQLVVVDPDNQTVAGPWVETVETDPYVNGFTELAPNSFGPVARVTGLAVRDGRAVVSASTDWTNRAYTISSPQYAAVHRYWSVDTRSDTFWIYTYEAIDSPASPALVSAKGVFVRYPYLEVLDAENGAIAGRNYGVYDARDQGAGMAYRDGVLYAPIAAKLYAFDDGLRPVWESPADIDGLLFFGSTLGFDDAVVATAAAGRDAPHTILVFDRASGVLRWSHALAAPADIAAVDGLIVAVDQFGTLTVLGDLPFSLRVGLTADSRYPGPGKEVRVDLSGSPPSPLGPPTSFRAQWGDGTRTEWQQDPVLRHTYAAAGDVTARVQVRNEAGQISSVPLTFHVGQKDPAVNIFNSPFDAEYQETSFFLLGLVATAAVAAFGVFRAGRKRRRFQNELRGLEAEATRLADDARACDAMLQARRAQARALFLQKRLEEPHAAFLERRVEELRRSLRLGTIEDRLKFLPYGMVGQLQRLLADGRVDEWERGHFLDALAAQKDLTARQRADARRIIDDWFARDQDVRA